MLAGISWPERGLTANYSIMANYNGWITSDKSLYTAQAEGPSQKAWVATSLSLNHSAREGLMSLALQSNALLRANPDQAKKHFNEING